MERFNSSHISQGVSADFDGLAEGRFDDLYWDERMDRRSRRDTQERRLPNLTAEIEDYFTR